MSPSVSPRAHEIHYGRIVAATSAEGPGLRSALWVAGCSIRCDGCFNAHLFDRTTAAIADVSELFVALTADSNVEGTTFLGGEPFDQAPALASLAAMVRLAGMSVMTFTGYRYERLISGRIPGATELLGQTDLLVDGPFLRHKVDNRRAWIGSTNQRLIALTDRYRHEVEALAVGPDRIELTVSAAGLVALNGWAEPALMNQLFDAISVDRQSRITAP